MKTIDEIKQLTNHIMMSIFEIPFHLRIEHDNINIGGRIFLQIVYYAKCNKTGEYKLWHGRKWYLSDYMTDDEIVKTAFAAFKSVIEHEIMEGFKINGLILFNPHVDYKELLKISNNEIQRNEKI